MFLKKLFSVVNKILIVRTYKKKIKNQFILNFSTSTFVCNTQLPCSNINSQKFPIVSNYIKQITSSAKKPFPVVLIFFSSCRLACLSFFFTWPVISSHFFFICKYFKVDKLIQVDDLLYKTFDKITLVTLVWILLQESA